MLQEGLLFAERYELLKKLGSGGFSEVWLALDTETKVQIAVKVYASSTGLDEDGLEIFRQEFALVFDLNHTNLLRPTYFGTWQKRPFLIMPLCKNGSAYKFLKEGVGITEQQCWEMLRDVASGLAYMHSKTPPLIHQDIKPDNILISDEGRYMITDFGISSKVRSTFRTLQDVDGTLSAGTVAYMGPERFSTKPRPIMASDIWSLGAMMFELMTGGSMPFGNFGGVLQKKGADVPEIEGDYSEELKNLVSRCLRQEPWERPTAEAIAQQADDHLHGRKTVVIESNQGSDDLGANQTVGSQGQTDDRETSVMTHAVRERLTQQAEQRISQQQVRQDSPVPPAPAPVQKDGKQKLIIGLVCLLVLAIGIAAYLFLSGGNKTDSGNHIAVDTVRTVAPSPAAAESAVSQPMQNTVPLDTVSAADVERAAAEKEQQKASQTGQAEKTTNTGKQGKEKNHEVPEQPAGKTGPGFTIGTAPEYTGPTTVTVTSNINKAMVVIDGVDRGWAPWTGRIEQGSHTFAVKAKNKDKYTVNGGTRNIRGKNMTISVSVADPTPFN